MHNLNTLRFFDMDVTPIESLIDFEMKLKSIPRIGERLIDSNGDGWEIEVIEHQINGNWHNVEMFCSKVIV